MYPFSSTRSKKRSTFSFKILVLLLVGLTVFLVKATIGVWQKQRASAEKLAQSQREREELEEREAELIATIERLKTDRGIEEEIREKLNVARPGERVVTIVDEREGADGSIPRRTLWSWFTSLFKRK